MTLLSAIIKSPLLLSQSSILKTKIYPIFILRTQEIQTQTFSSTTSTKPKNSKKKNILVIGCNGSLGASILSSSKKQGYNIIGADISDPSTKTNEKLEHFIPIPQDSTDSIVALNEHLQNGVMDYIEQHSQDENSSKANNLLDGIVCTSGAFAMDPTHTKALTTTQEYAKSFDSMLQANLYPIICGGLIGMEFLKPNGLFLSIGATAALNPTPNMAAYGLSKSASHHLIQTLGNTSLASKPYSDLSQSFMTNNICTISILPTTLDTPNNRSEMPSANFDLWTKPSDVSNKIWEWITHPDLRPHSGSLIQVLVVDDKKNGACETVFQIASAET